MSQPIKHWCACPDCGDPEPGKVWVRVGVDHELSAICSTCNGEAVIEVELEPYIPQFDFNDPTIQNPFRRSA